MPDYVIWIDSGVYVEADNEELALKKARIKLFEWLVNDMLPGAVSNLEFIIEQE